jgi:glyoxylase-like metal-dependent hydrolase (beta-lactamase superfamily II)
MPFLTESEPPRGEVLDALPGIARIVARNPSVMTYHGTNTWLIEHEAHGLTVLDPGPEQERHVDDILAAAGDRPIERIVLTHAHSDHYGAVAALKARSGAETWGFEPSAAGKFAPDHVLRDGDVIAALAALHTPGHAADHLCFAYEVPGTGTVLFSGDHVMSWSSSIVNPPDGDMRAYYASLGRLLDRPDDVLYLPGHGPVLPQPRALVAQMLAHRRAREASILDQLKSGLCAIPAIAEKLYGKSNPWLKIASERNVLAHLLKLEAEGLVRRDGEAWTPAGC